ncbi:hypothetical protein BDZ89DRAFT_1115109 [Hymenopellis radicata]|nr:hypothetical protein BDZ89DRAFT_1115109 [Hymenopellis radicata]
MSFRLPSNLDTFIPPPGTPSVPPSALTRPWRGSLIVRGLRISDADASHDIKVTSVETDGDNRTDTWPDSLIFSVAPPYDLPILSQLQSYIQQPGRQPVIPICTFLPDRLRDPDQNTANVASFRHLSRVLFERRTVALAPLSGTSPAPGMPNPIPTSGILIFPASNSTALLVGAIFAGGVPFPGFVLSALRRARGDLPPISPATPSQGVPISMQSRSQQQRMMHSSAGYTTRPDDVPYLNTSSLRYPSASLSPVSPAAQGVYDRGHSYGPYGDQPAPRISSHSQQQQQQYASGLMSPNLNMPSTSAGPSYAPSYRQTDAFGRWPKEEPDDASSQQPRAGSSRYP